MEAFVHEWVPEKVGHGLSMEKQIGFNQQRREERVFVPGRGNHRTHSERAVIFRTDMERGGSVVKWRLCRGGLDRHVRNWASSCSREALKDRVED